MKEMKMQRLHFWEDTKSSYQKLNTILLPNGLGEVRLKILKVKEMRSYVYLETQNSLVFLVNVMDAKET